DIHINPAPSVFRIFYRIDGVLQYGHCVTKTALSGVISRIKVLSQLDIAEQRLPKDGSFRSTVMNRNYDFRVSTIPTVYGENVVMRILSGSTSLQRIDTLGFDTAAIG